MLVVDELSLCTTRDFHQIILPLAKLGCTLWLGGDCRRQLLSIGDVWHGSDLARDLTDTVMLRSAVGRKTLVLTEGKRCDARLFEYLSRPLDVEAARLAFPARGRPAETNLCLAPACE